MNNKNILLQKLGLYICEIKSLLRNHSQELFSSTALELVFIQLLEIMKKDNTLDINNYIKGELNLREVKNDEEYENAVENLIKLNPILENLITDSIKTIRICGEDVLTRRLRGYNYCFYDEIEDIGEFFKKSIFIANRKGLSSSDITSESVCELISVLLKDEKTKEIFDQTVGTGYLLSEVAKYHKDAQLYGQDIHLNSVKICKMLLILEGKFKSVENIKQGNTLTNPAFIEKDCKIKSFDMVICDMPFVIKDYGFDIIKEDKYKRFYRGLPKKSSADYAFLTNLVESINEGRVGIAIVPTGVLFKMGTDGKIRESFLKENIIDCIISLPNNILYGTKVATNLIIFRKGKTSKDILFIDASKEGITNRKVTYLSEKSINKIKSVYDNRVSIESFSKVVKLQEIEEKDSNLMVQKYVMPIVVKEKLDLEKLSEEVEELSGKLTIISDKLNNIFKE